MQTKTYWKSNDSVKKEQWQEGSGLNCTVSSFFFIDPPLLVGEHTVCRIDSCHRSPASMKGRCEAGNRGRRWTTSSVIPLISFVCESRYSTGSEAFRLQDKTRWSFLMDHSSTRQTTGTTWLEIGSFLFRRFFMLAKYDKNRSNTHRHRFNLNPPLTRRGKKSQTPVSKISLYRKSDYKTTD